MSRKRMQHELFEARKVQEYEEAVARKKAAASGGTPGQPPAQQQGHGILGFIVKGEAEADSVTGRAGLTLVVEGFRAYQGDVLVRNWLKLKKRNRGCARAQNKPEGSAPKLTYTFRADTVEPSHRLSAEQQR
jgi:hypothetical protein